jgi:hypothetical protein
MRIIRLTAAAVVAAGALVLPATALAALSGHSHGYSLTFSGGRATLKLPSVAKAYTPFQVKCGAKGQEETVIALAPLSASSTLQGPAARPKSHRCIIQRRMHTVATVHLH